MMIRYGLPFVSPHNLLVSTVNGAGAAIESIYMILFIIYAKPQKVRVKILTLFTLILTVFAIVVLVSLFALHENSRKLFCGFAATIVSICMYASPLSIVVVIECVCLCWNLILHEMEMHKLFCKFNL
ncbi:hypothetical protein MKX03_025872 [Papaver bracteatum]|nr:hypothetical protein MKX03_025872 [Papaver bracteatum]